MDVYRDRRSTGPRYRRPVHPAPSSTGVRLALALALALTLMLPALGCSKEEESPAVDPQEVFAAAVPAMKDTSSFSFTYDVNAPGDRSRHRAR